MAVNARKANSVVGCRIVTERMNTLMGLARYMKQSSKCRDKKTSAVLAVGETERVLAVGINSGPKPDEHCICSDNSKYTCLHAEINCLLNYMHVITVQEMFAEKILVCSKLPCAMCATAIINSDINIKKVVYDEDYHDKTGKELLEKAGIEVEKYDD